MSKKKTTSATEQLAEAKAQLELAQIEKASRLLESNQPVVVPWMEYPAYDEYSYTAKSPYFYSSISDRQGEQYLPLYRNEMDLRTMRARARNMETLFSVAVGARDCLTNYTIGNGISVEVQPKASGSETLAKQLQAEIDGFLDYNNFPGVMDREIHQLSRVEGECFPTLYEEDENIRCEITDADAITEPAQPMPLERMARTNGKLNHWHLGVHTTYSKILKRDDATRPLGYHAVYDELGDDWDYLPANRVEHIKRNVLRSARRGWSDYEAVIEDLEQLAKIKRNTAVGAAILAAIVLIREHAPGVSKSSIESMVSGGATSSRTVFTDTGGGRTRYSEHTPPGTVKDVPNGMKSMLGPLGSLNSPIYIEVAQFVLRIISVRWGIPEYMISGDASNNNLNSADMAESSFAKFREADQGFYSRHFEELLWKVIAIRLGAGALGGLSLKQIKAAVQIKVTLPDVVSRDTKDLAAENEILIRNRVKSRRTWAGELGLDYDEEQREIAEEDAQAQERMSQEMEIQAANQPDPELAQKVQEEYAAQQRAYREALEGVETGFVVEDCGANAPGGGGFQAGNTCAKGKTQLTVRPWQVPRGGGTAPLGPDLNVIEGEIAGFPITTAKRGLIGKISKKTTKALEDVLSDSEIVELMRKANVSHLQLREKKRGESWTMGYADNALMFHTKSAEAIDSSKVETRRIHGMQRVVTHEVGHAVWHWANNDAKKAFDSEQKKHSSFVQKIGSIVNIEYKGAFDGGSKVATEVFAEMTAMRKYAPQEYASAPAELQAAHQKVMDSLVTIPSHLKTSPKWTR